MDLIGKNTRVNLNCLLHNINYYSQQLEALVNKDTLLNCREWDKQYLFTYNKLYAEIDNFKQILVMVDCQNIGQWPKIRQSIKYYNRKLDLNRGNY